MADYWIYLLIMVVSTYLIRAIPFVAVQKKIENQFIRSFLCYIPYTVLSAMTFPAALYATDNIYAAAAGVAVAISLAFMRRGLTTVAVASCVTVFICDGMVNLF